jgi:hypothetical protein
MKTKKDGNEKLQKSIQMVKQLINNDPKLNKKIIEDVLNASKEIQKWRGW